MAAWKWMPFKRERVNKWETEEDKDLIPQMLAEWIYFFCKSFLFIFLRHDNLFTSRIIQCIATDMIVFYYSVLSKRLI